MACLNRTMSMLFALAALAGCGGDDAVPVTDGGGAMDSATSDAARPDGGGDGVDAAALDAPPPPPDSPSGALCGARACTSDEICMQRVSCPKGPPLAPECIRRPPSCGATPSCDCFTSNVCGGCATCGSVEGDRLSCSCVCICAAPDTLIATPTGERPIASLGAGDLVYSVDHGQVRAVALLRVGRAVAPRDHAIVRVTLSNGTVIEMSPGHPTANGRSFGELSPGARLGDVTVVGVETVPYERPFTYDILPASDTGTYFASGALVGSTLAARAE